MKPVSVGKNLVAATKTTMFTVPEEYQASWNLLYANNGTTSAKHFTAWWYDKSADTEVIILFEYNLSAKAFLKFDGAYIILEAGDEIRVQIETGATNAACVVTLDLEKKSAVQF